LLGRIGVTRESGPDEPGEDGQASGGGTPILLGGSTFPGEEAILGRVFLKLREQRPDLFLIIAPRHVERTPEVEATLREIGLRPLLRSTLDARNPAPGQPGQPSTGSGLLQPARPDVLIINTTGELPQWYRLATVCFVGKSLTAIGGQNPAEPLLAGRPVCFGPHMENFGALARQLLDAQAAIQVRDETALAEAVDCLLSNPVSRTALVDRARVLLRTHEGANRRTAAVLLEAKLD
jgi:3-deoxy-D-manno-octulosonic-acid transferase